MKQELFLSGLAIRGGVAIFAGVTGKLVFRLAAGFVLLVVVFTQVGLNLLHAHRGQPESVSVALSPSAESDNASCPVCALDGLPSFCGEQATFVVPDFSSTPYDEAVISAVLLPNTSRSSGRAPPFC